MLGNIKIGTRLLASFGVIFALMLILTVSGLYILSSFNASTKQIGKIDTPKIQDAYSVNVDVKNIFLAIAGLSIVKEPKIKNDLTAQIENSRELYKSAVAELEKLETTDEGKRLIAAFKQVIADAKEADDKAVELSFQGKENEAGMIYQNQIIHFVKSIDLAGAALIKHNKEIVDARYVKLDSVFSFSRMLFIILSIISAIGCVVLGLVLSRSITKPLTKGVEVMQELAKGHISARLNMNQKDEIGVLAETMDSFADNLQKQVVGVIKKIGDGDLSTDVKAADGEDEIMPAIIATTESLRGLVAEAGMLRKAAVEGKLATRGNAGKFKGGYRDIVQGVNETLDAVINPLNVAADYVDKISKGNIPAKITDNYNGDFNTIKNNLNQCIETINSLIASANMLSKAAVEGKINTRGDANAFNGGYRDIIQGVNDAIGSLVGFIDAMPAPAMIIDKEFTIQYINKAGASLGSMDQKQVVNMKCYNFFKTDECNTDRCACGKAMRSGQMVSSEAVAKPVAGTFEIDYTGVPIKDKAGMVLGAFEVVTDQTTVKKAQRLAKKIAEYQVKEIENASSVLKKVAERDLTVRVNVSGGDSDTQEIRDLFVTMAGSINTAVENLDQALTQVASATEQVSSGGQQISAGAQSLAQGANEQASSLEEVSSSLEEMAAMTKQNAENASQANNLAAEANRYAASGTEAMERMNASITKIKESSDQTAKIVKTIDEIAMQTNLLALNAAVEAARAGEAGRGFAVVAEEVRNLAQRSADAAKNTADMIEESVKNAEDGVNISAEVGKSFLQIAASSKKVNDLIAEIASASQEQSTGIDQVNVAVSQMDKVTQQNAANSEESASAAEEMSSQAEELQSLVGQFILSQTIQNKTVAHKTAAAQHQLVEPKKAPVAQVKNGNGKSRLKNTEMSKSGKALAEQLIPMEEEMLSKF